MKPSKTAAEYNEQFSEDIHCLKKISDKAMPKDVKKVLEKYIFCSRAAIEETTQAIASYDFYEQAKEPYPYENYIHCLGEAYFNLLHASYLLESLMNREDTISGYAYGKASIDEILMFFFNIHVKQKKEWLEITINKRLPQRRANRTELSRYKKRLENAFAQQVKPNKRYRNVYMIIEHHYDKSNPSLFRDVDNYEEKPLSDILADYFIAGGDGPENVQRCSFSKPDNSDFTVAYLVPKEQIGTWFLAQKRIENNVILP